MWVAFAKHLNHPFTTYLQNFEVVESSSFNNSRSHWYNIIPLRKKLMIFKPSWKFGDFCSISIHTSFTKIFMLLTTRKSQTTEFFQSGTNMKGRCGLKSSPTQNVLAYPLSMWDSSLDRISISSMVISHQTHVQNSSLRPIVK